GLAAEYSSPLPWRSPRLRLPPRGSPKKQGSPPEAPQLPPEPMRLKLTLRNSILILHRHISWQETSTVRQRNIGGRLPSGLTIWGTSVPLGRITRARSSYSSRLWRQTRMILIPPSTLQLPSFIPETCRTRKPTQKRCYRSTRSISAPMRYSARLIF